MTNAQNLEDRSILVVFMVTTVYGIDRATGAIRWKTKVACTMGVAEIAIVSGWVIACTDSHLHFLEYATGRQASSVKHQFKGAGMRTVLLIDQGQILVGVAGELMAYSMNGQPLWYQPLKGEGAGAMALGVPGNVRQADYVGG